MTALTRRERKVKDVLLKELAGLEEVGGLSYVQKQRLEKRLDPAYIDDELTKIRERLRSIAWWQNAAFALTALSVLASVATLAWGVAFSFNHVQWPLIVGVQAATLTYQRRSTRRRLFIYEALRELSGADEAGIELDRVIEEADKLIVRSELDADALPGEDASLSAAARHPQHVPSAPPTPKQRAAPAPEGKGVSLAEMQRRKEKGSTILDA